MTEDLQNVDRVAPLREQWMPPVVEFFNLSDAAANNSGTALAPDANMTS